MKKFSKISGVKVSKEPKLKEVPDPKLEMKFRLLNLIDENLKVMSYGSNRRNILTTVKIIGQDNLVDALLDFLSEKETKDQIKVLESLKGRNKDWESIDKEIDVLNKKIYEMNILEKYRNDISKLNAFLHLYGEDESNFVMVLENYCDKIKNKEIFKSRREAAKILLESSGGNDKLISIMIDKFSERAMENDI